MNRTYVYVVKSGENLSDITSKLLGSNNRHKWIDLLIFNPHIQVTYTTHNGMRLPVAHLFVGQKINIPNNWLTTNRIGVGDNDTASNEGHGPTLGLFEPGKAPWDYFNGSVIYWLNSSLDNLSIYNYITSYFCDTTQELDSCISKAQDYFAKKFNMIGNNSWTTVLISPDQSADTINWADSNNPDWFSLNAIFPSNYADFDDQIFKLRLSSLKSDFINHLPTALDINWNKFMDDNAVELSRRVALRNIISKSNSIMDNANADSFIEKNWPISNTSIKNKVVSEAYKSKNVNLPTDQYGAIQYNKIIPIIVIQYAKDKLDKYLKGEDNQSIIGNIIRPMLPFQPICGEYETWDENSKSCIPEERGCDLDSSKCAKLGKDFDSNTCNCIPKQHKRIGFVIPTAADCKEGETFLEKDHICVPSIKGSRRISEKDCTKDQIFNEKTSTCVDIPISPENPTPEQCADSIIATLKLAGKYDEQVTKYGSDSALYSFVLDQCNIKLTETGGCKITTADCKEGQEFDQKQCKCVPVKAEEKSYTWLYILGGLVILGGAGAGYYYYSKNKKQKLVSSGELAVREPAEKEEYLTEEEQEIENSKRIVEDWMIRYRKDYVSAEDLASGASDNFGLYEYNKIPGWVLDIALEVINKYGKSKIGEPVRQKLSKLIVDFRYGGVETIYRIEQLVGSKVQDRGIVPTSVGRGIRLVWYFDMVIHAYNARDRIKTDHDLIKDHDVMISVIPGSYEDHYQFNEPARQMARIYVGVYHTKPGPGYTIKTDIFRSLHTPENNTHPKYSYVIGPFKTKTAAEIMAEAVRTQNPNIQTVAQAEKLAKK